MGINSTISLKKFYQRKRVWNFSVSEFLVACMYCIVCHLVALNLIFSLQSGTISSIDDICSFTSLKFIINLNSKKFWSMISYFTFADLSHNRLSRIPTNALSHLSNLTALDLSYNNIHQMMPGTVYPWRNLHMLNISGNNQLDLFNLRLTFYVSCVKFSRVSAAPVPISLFVWFRWDMAYDSFKR